MALTGREKATILLSLLGAELAESIIRYLPADLADVISEGINHLPNPSADAVKSVLDELTSFMALPEASYPRRAIEGSSVMQTEELSKRSATDIVFYSSPKKLAAALSAERVPVSAYILSIFPKPQAAEVLSFMGDMSKEVEMSLRVIKTPSISDHFKENVIDILAKRLERMSAQG